MRTKSHNQNKLLRIISIPIRILGKAKDLYVQSIKNSSERMRCGGLAGVDFSSLPKSLSARSSRCNGNDDYSELIRAASARSFGNIIDMDMILQQQTRSRQSSTDTTIMVGLNNNKGLPKSCSVGMSKIDEDSPCEFEAEDGAESEMKPKILYPRSKSYVVTKRNIGF